MRWTVAFCAVSDPAKPRLLVVNQYYWPGVEATAHLLTELCERSPTSTRSAC